LAQYLKSDNLPLVSVLVTTYERFDLLKIVTDSLVLNLDYPRNRCQLILADDGSSESTQRKMKSLPYDTFVFSKKNRGLGANINAGQKAMKGEFLLYLQDDCELKPGDGFVYRAINLMKSDSEIGIVRLFCVDGLDYSRQKTSSEKIVRKYRNSSSAGLYTDLPHIKSREFIEYIGPYKDSKYSQYTETNMKKRFGSQKKYTVACFEEDWLFRHIGDEQSWRQRNPTLRERLGLFRREFLKRMFGD
jgi:glycosyltransferase involved in cell wall biosynthesis